MEGPIAKTSKQSTNQTALIMLLSQLKIHVAHAQYKFQFEAKLLSNVQI